MRMLRPSSYARPEFPLTNTSASALKARWSATDSVLTANINGTGARPTDGGVVGRISDLTGNGYYLTSSSEGANVRPIWYQDGFNLGRASIHANLTTQDCFNNTTLAADVFTGTNPSFTVIMLYSRWLENFGSSPTCYIWGVIKNGGSIAASAGNPFLGTRNDNGLYNAIRPIAVAAYGTDASTSPSTTSSTWDDNALGGSPFGCGAGSSSIICMSRVENGQTVKLYQNGHLIQSMTKTSGAYTFASGDYVSFFKMFNGTTRTGNLGGHLYEACVFNDDLSDADRQKIEEYYMGLVGMEYTRTDVTLRPRTWFFGHSMFIGTEIDGTQAHATPVYRIAQGSHIPIAYRQIVSNQSFGGQHFTAGGATNDAFDSLDVKDGTVPDLKSADIIIHRGITNDCSEDDSSNAAIETLFDTELTSFKTFITNALAKVAFFIEMFDPPQGNGTLTTNGGGVTQAKLDIRNHGLAYWRTISRAWLGRYHRCTWSDSYALLADGNGDLLDYAESTDGIHLTKAGYRTETVVLGKAVTHLTSYNPATVTGAVAWWGGGEQLTTLVDGDPLAIILDWAASLDTTSATPPTFKVGTAATNYKAYISYDGATTNNDISSFTETPLTAWTIVYSTTGVTYATVNPILADAGSTSVIRLPSSITTVVVDTAGGTITFTHAARADGDVEMITSDGKHYLNGVLSTSSGTITQNLTIDTIGRSTATFCGGIINLWVNNTVLSAANRRLCGEFFAYQTGKTWVTQ